MINHYILDASIVIQRFIEQEYTPQAKILFNSLLVGEEFYIPEFLFLQKLELHSPTFLINFS